MNAEEFTEISVDDARSKVSKIGLKGLTKKNPGEFYYDFFRWGLWRPDFKDKLSILVEHGLDLNQPVCERWNEKRTPIFQALSDPDGKTAAAIKALAECGADINLPDANGRTPIMAASFYQHGLSKSSIVKALIKFGADLHCKDNKGKLVTALADANSLPVLIKAGAPINVKSQAILLTALRSGNLEITIGLLKKGAKAKLGLSECLNTAFLATIAHTEPELFKKGLSLKKDDGSWGRYHHTFRKAAADFLKLLEACDDAPMAKEVEVFDDDTLPATLRVGAWPPQRPEPTGPINVQAPPASAPDFHFPSDLQSACVQMCEIKSDERSADKKRSAFSKFISTIEKTLTDIEYTDWETETRKFIKKPIPRVHRASTSSPIWRANELLRHYQEVAFNTYYTEQVHRELDRGKGPLRINIGMGFTNTFNHFVAIKTSVPTLGQADLRVWSNDEDLLKDKQFILYAERIENGVLFTRNVEKEINLRDISIFEDSDIKKYLNIFKFVKFKGLWSGAEKIHYCALAYRIGPSVSDALQSIAETGNEHALDCLSHLNAESLASFMAETLSQPGRAKNVQAWFRLFPETAVTGLLECSFGSDLNERSNAQQALRLFAENGSRQLIIDCALKFGQEAQAVAIEFLGYDSRADFLPKKMPKLPGYFIARAHPAPTLKSSGEELPPHAIETLVRMMLVSTCHVQNSALQDVIEACDRHSLAEFALSTFDVWCRNRAKKDGIGFLYALAYLGDNRAAALLGKSYRNAPPTAATPVIEVLAAIGSNIAIAGLQAIARSSLNDKSRKIAQEVLDDVARDRGLTPAMLEDLSVPDLGLDSNGQMSLDFGPRKFVVTINANLEAILTDGDGNAHKTLPKPVKADNAHKAKTATAQWKEFKAALKGQATDQKKRFEQAMLLRREWDSATFKEIVAIHPLLSKMVCTLVWATVKGDEPDTAFRIDTDGRYVTADGAELTLDDEAMVTLPHPLLLGDKVDTWLQIFADNKLTQPFPQLARKWFAEGPETEDLIRARDGTKVPLGSLRGLKAKGWEFEEGGAGMVWSVYKRTEGARASIDVEPGWFLSGYDFEDFGGDQTVKLDVSGSDPITYSELVREFLSLPVTEG
jgi:hypothetical protein